MHHVTLKALGSQPSHHHIRGCISDSVGDYLLEVANTCEASPKLLALAALAPEFEEFLQLLDTPLANMLKQKWWELERAITPAYAPPEMVESDAT
jgi:hypothetical protein